VDVAWRGDDAAFAAKMRRLGKDRELAAAMLRQLSEDERLDIVLMAQDYELVEVRSAYLVPGPRRLKVVLLYPNGFTTDLATSGQHAIEVFLQAFGWTEAEASRAYFMVSITTGTVDLMADTQHRKFIFAKHGETGWSFRRASEAAQTTR
jgi:hypothetical protein